MDTSNKKTQKKPVESRRKSAYFSKNNNFRKNEKKSTKKVKGGRTTISPPAKISPDPESTLKPLPSNIDTITLSIDVVWEDLFFFLTLEEAKSIARSEKIDCPVDFKIEEYNQGAYYFNVKPSGANGYEWILLNNDYTLLIGNWEKPISKPSIQLTIRSEALWQSGPSEAIRFALSFLQNQKAIIQQIKVSRLDLCLDTLFPENIWGMDMLRYKVTRATYHNPHFTHDILTGISIGKGKISARLYDKVLEIKQQSKKTWMYDIWGFNEAPANYKVIRVEFQLRREVIKQFLIHSIDDLFDKLPKIWIYCAKEWLKFQENPGQPSRDRTTLPWWEAIQKGFKGAAAAYPLVRIKASSAEKKAICQQTIGLLSALAAIATQTTDYFKNKPVNLKTSVILFYDTVLSDELNDGEFRARVETKLAEYQRSDKKMKENLEKVLGSKNQSSNDSNS